MRRVRAAVSGVTVLVGVLFGSTARAQCGDFGGLGVAFGGLVGAGSTVVTGFGFPAIAKAANPRLRYWPGVGWTALGGLAGTIGGVAIASSDCPYPESFFRPTAFSIPAAALTTTMWGYASAPKDEPSVALFIARPRTGSGALIGISGTL